MVFTVKGAARALTYKLSEVLGSLVPVLATKEALRAATGEHIAKLTTPRR
jgi:hypothetical protein